MRTASTVGCVVFVSFGDQGLHFERPLKSFGSRSSRGSKNYQVIQACLKIYLYKVNTDYCWVLKVSLKNAKL